MIKNDWHPYSALGIILKDAGIVTEAARKEAFPVPLASAAEQEYLRGVQAGFCAMTTRGSSNSTCPKTRATWSQPPLPQISR